MLRVAAYTGGPNEPSARFRVRAYLPSLAEYGVSITDFPARHGQYPPAARWRRPLWFGCRLAEAFAAAPRSRRCDLVLFQRELLSTFVTAEPFYGRPRVLDVDDAIWLHRRGSYALRLARLCDAVICGNGYLADHFSASGRKIFILPTAVDTRQFTPKASAPERPVIGWSGSSSNLHLLESLDDALAVVLERHRGAKLRVVCDRAPRFLRVPSDAIEYIPWSPAVEVSALQGFSVGLMPLADNAWALGKCAFKMLTYMACGIPVVVSPVGMNDEILRKAEVGLAARNDGEWVDRIDWLLSHQEHAVQMGANGRQLVEEEYSLSTLAPKLAGMLREIAGAAGESTSAIR